MAPRVVIAVPLATPLIYWKTVAAILEMKKPEGTDLMVFQGALVDRARNYLVEQMLNHPMEATHIFFLDSDIVPAPDTLIKLLSAKSPIVSGLYRKRIPPHEPMAFLRRQGRQSIFEPISPKGSRLRNVDVVGAGCLLIRREVFEKMKPPWFASHWSTQGHLSEDFFFCEKAKSLGYSILVHTGVTPLHVEPMGIGTNKKGSVSWTSLS